MEGVVIIICSVLIVLLIYTAMKLRELTAMLKTGPAGPARPAVEPAISATFFASRQYLSSNFD
jgi:hypothetical protein